MDEKKEKIEISNVAQGDKADVEKNKTMAIVGYIFPILFFIPLVNEESKKSPFAKFHANQQIILLGLMVIVYVIVNILAGMVWYIPMLWSIIGILWLAYSAGSIFFIIMGIINVNNGAMKELPIVGKLFKFIK